MVELPPRMQMVEAVRRGREAVRRQLMFNNANNWNLRNNNNNNNLRVTYENKPLPQNATNMVTQGGFAVGDKVVKYARNKYMKVSDFSKYLRSPKAGRSTLKRFLAENGNKKFTSPESITFRKSDVKFYRFI